ncbi:MAG: TolC family protein, partial [Acidobacteria bacterium]|nr:TolC family protein [Acidobacteriota bacterium]
MKCLYIYIIMAIIYSTLCLPALPAEERTVITGITLVEAIQNGLARAAAYQDQVLDVKSLELENQSAKMKRYFSLDTNASYLFRSEQMEISFPGKMIKAGARHNYDINLSLKQPLFTGNILSQAVKLSALELAAAENEVSLERIAVATEIKVSYFNYFLLQDKKNSLGTLIEQLNLHLQKIENFYKEELVRKTDLLETKRKLKEQELNLEDLNNLIAAEKIRFEKLCGLDINNVNAGYVENVPGYDGAWAEFISAHPVLKTLDQNIEMLNARMKIVKGTY